MTSRIRLRLSLTLGFCAFAGLALAPSIAVADDVVIKLGTLAPQGSPWHNLLKEMGQKWAEASGNKVTLRIYPGGVMGNEGDMVRKMRVGQIQAAAITTIGLHEITPEPQAISAPMLINTYDELDYVMPRVTPSLEAALAAKGFVVLNWADAGFVHFFAVEKKSFRAPGEAKDKKIFAWEGDPASVDAWRAAGFQPVVLSATDLMQSLETGMIDVNATVPLYAMGARLYRKANKMLDLPWGVLIGATVVKKDAWEQIPVELRGKLLAIAHDYGSRVNVAVRKMNQEAIEQMKKQGLEVVAPTDLPGWQKLADRGNEVVRGRVVPAPIFDEVKRLAAEYHSGKH